MALTSVETVPVALPRQRVGGEDRARAPEPRRTPLLDARWVVDLAASGGAAAATGLASRSLLLMSVLVLVWARVPRAVTQRGAWPPGETGRLLRRCVTTVGLLVLVDQVAATPAREVDMVVATLAALLGSVVGGQAVARIPVLAGTRAAARQLVVHREQDEVSAEDLGLAETATLHRLVGRADPVSVIAHKAKLARADEVVLLPEAGLSADQLRRLGWQLERLGASLRLVTPLRSLTEHRLRVRPLGEHVTVDVLPRALAGVPATLKGWSERLLALVALTCAGPVLLVVMALIRLESPGSPIFRQVRVGKDGQPFTMFKLRSMYSGSELAKKELEAQNQHGADGVLFKMKRDPRVTRVGALIRRSSLDEVPQLVNVVRGEMSLIGPRPGLPAEVEKYDETATRRLAVLPGLTGLWQVSGRSDLSWKESVELDLHYVENWRPLLDLQIVARTFHAVVSAKGAD